MRSGFPSGIAQKTKELERFRASFKTETLQGRPARHTPSTGKRQITPELHQIFTENGNHNGW
jgi:hypothetical protein